MREQAYDLLAQAHEYHRASDMNLRDAQRNLREARLVLAYALLGLFGWVFAWAWFAWHVARNVERVCGG